MSKAKKDDAKKKSKPAGSQFLGRVYVSLKPTVNDPEGISSLGFDGVAGVRSGRYFQITLQAADKKAAKGQVDQMCARLLANPVIETYSFEIDEI
jgi:phosphoribosylformylglycinamidine synthase subunit PurS